MIRKIVIGVVVIAALILALMVLGVVYLAAFRGIEFGDFTYKIEQ